MRVAAPLVHEVELGDRLAVGRQRVAAARRQHSRVAKFGIGRAIDPVALEVVQVGHGVERVLRDVVPRQAHGPVLGLGVDRRAGRRHRELVVRVVDLLHDVDVLAQLGQVGAEGERQAEALVLARVEAERARRE